VKKFLFSKFELLWPQRFGCNNLPRNRFLLYIIRCSDHSPIAPGMKFVTLPLAVLLALCVVAPSPANAADQTEVKFDFGSGAAKPQHTRVMPSDVYLPEKGYGFENSPALSASAGGISSDKPFLFSVKLPEGNYNVTAILGDGKAASAMTIKAEARRLMIEQAPVAPGKFEARIFTVNIRTPQIKGKGQVKINSRELGPPLALRWDRSRTIPTTTLTADMNSPSAWWKGSSRRFPPWQNF
jgi:hypothetical protein